MFESIFKHPCICISIRFYMILSGLRVGPLKDAPLPWTCLLTQLRRHDIGRPSRRPVVHRWNCERSKGSKLMGPYLGGMTIQLPVILVVEQGTRVLRCVRLYVRCCVRLLRILVSSCLPSYRFLVSFWPFIWDAASPSKGSYFPLVSSCLPSYVFLFPFIWDAVSIFPAIPTFFLFPIVSLHISFMPPVASLHMGFCVCLPGFPQHAF